MSQFTASGAYLDQLRQTLLTHAVKTEGAQMERIVAWLASLRLLYGVPYWYLVPDTRMLPAESIKFFQLDENWINCLIDGAFSLGRSTTADGLRDGAIVNQVIQQVTQRARELRDEKFAIPAPAEEGRASGFSATGFLLRSALVSGWPAMHVRAQSGGKRARKVRFEVVAPNVLFCLFDCQVDSVTFSEPVEILHFGLDEPASEGSPYTKTLRYVDSGDPAIPPGTQMSTQIPVTLSPQRVVDVTALAGQIQTALITNGGMQSTTAYTPAEFALELVEGVQQITFTLGGTA